MIKKIIHRIIRADEEGLRTHKAMLRLLTHVSGASNLLDIGCAQGFKTVDYAELLGIPAANIKGIELHDHYRLIAQEKFETLSVDIERDVFPFDDEAFDLIVCNQVLEHLKNIFRPLAEIDRKIKIGGHLIIGIPNLSGLYNRLLVLAGAQPQCSEITGPHIRVFAHRPFVKFLKTNSNFELIRINSATLYPLPYPLVDWLGGFFPGLAAVTFYLLRKKKHDPSACLWHMNFIGDTCLD